MKKLFPEKRMTKKKFLDFLDKKGFYIVLILCIAIVGATAIFVTTHNLTSSNKDFNPGVIIPEGFDDEFQGHLSMEPDIEEPIDSALVLQTESTAEKAGINPEDAAGVAQNMSVKEEQGKTEGSTVVKSDENKSQVAGEKVVAANTDAIETKTAAEKGITIPKTDEFILPVVGEVTFAFAADKLVYSKTLEEWRTHSGVDLAADRGTPVKAVGDGFVSDIKHDPRFGVTIIIDHGEGIKSLYANLASDDMVSPNQKIKQGDVIGCVGNTALFESAEQAHLHFEILKDDEPVNPDGWISIKND